MKIAVILLACIILASCGMLGTPEQTIGYQIINQPNSQPTIQVASNGAQTTGLYGGSITPGDASGGPLIGNSVGGDASRSTDADIEASVQRENRQSTSAQSRDQSPQDTDNAPTDSKVANTPVAVGEAASANVSGQHGEEGK